MVFWWKCAQAVCLEADFSNSVRHHEKTPHAAADLAGAGHCRRHKIISVLRTRREDCRFAWRQELLLWGNYIWRTFSSFFSFFLFTISSKGAFRVTLQYSEATLSSITTTYGNHWVWTAVLNYTNNILYCQSGTWAQQPTARAESGPSNCVFGFFCLPPIIILLVFVVCWVCFCWKERSCVLSV